MIFDDLTNWSRYFKGPIFDDIYQKLLAMTTDTKNGEHHRTDSYYFKVMSYDTINEPTIIESHKREVDIQIVLAGGERIKIYNKDNLKITTPYSEDTDCQFYKALKAAEMEFMLKPGKMAVFFPQDIHGCQYTLSNKVETIKKIVIKINEELFTH